MQKTIFVLLVLFLTYGCDGGSDKNNSDSDANEHPINVAGFWIYAANVEASEGNIEAHAGNCFVIQTDDLATFECSDHWRSNATGSTGKGTFNFEAIVHAYGMTIIESSVACDELPGRTNITI